MNPKIYNGGRLQTKQASVLDLDYGIHLEIKQRD